MAIARVQQNAVNNSGTTSSISISYLSPVSNGNLLVLGFYTDVTTGGISSIVETGVTWIKANQLIYSGQDIEIWYAPNVIGAGTSITVNFSAPVTNSEVCIMEYSGISHSLPLDQVASQGGFGSSPLGGLTATTTQASELWLSFFGVRGTNPTITDPTTGFSIIKQVGDFNSTATFIEEIVSSVGFVNTGVSTLGTTDNTGWAGLTVTFATTPVIIPAPVCTQTPFLTVADYIVELRERFAEINFNSWISDNDLIRWMNLGIDDIVMKTLPPRNESTPFLFTMVPGQFSYPLPANFFRMKEFGDSGGFYITGPTYFNVMLFEDKTDDLEDFLSQTNQNSIPSYFWFWNEQIYVFPIPDIAYTAKMYYYRLPITICNTTDTVDLDRPWVETLMKFVLWKSLEKDKHPMAQYYRGEYDLAVSTTYSESRIKVEKRARYVHAHDFYGNNY